MPPHLGQNVVNLHLEITRKNFNQTGLVPPFPDLVRGGVKAVICELTRCGFLPKSFISENGKLRGDCRARQANDDPSLLEMQHLPSRDSNQWSFQCFSPELNLSIMI